MGGPRTKAVVAVVAVVAASVFVAAPARAATFTVNTTADVSDPTPDGTCGSCSLREAIQEANALANNDVISLPVGTYTLSIAGASEDLGASGDLDVDPVVGGDEIQINGAGAGSTIVSAPPSFDRVFHVLSAGTLILNNLTVTGGSPPPGQDGGGILSDGPLDLFQSVVTGNTVTEDCISICLASFGGGIHSNGQLTITDSAVQNNTASGGDAGGIVSFGSLTILGSTIAGNQASLCSDLVCGGNAGGIWSFSTANIIDSTIDNNLADGGDGGGLKNSGTLMTLDRVLVRNNSIAGGGFGGGLASQSVTNIINSTFSGNASDDPGGWGGAIYCGFSCNVTLKNSTLAGNSTVAGAGGGIFNDGSPFNVTGSIVANNTPDNCVDIGSPSPGIVSSGFNLQNPGSDCPFTQPSDLVADPLLQPLAANGGPTDTMALPLGSPALDSGDPACPPPATDQRGIVRPQDGDGNGTSRCDRGAFEREAPPSPSPSPTAPPGGGGEPPQPGPQPTLTVQPTPTATPQPTPTATPTGTPTPTPTVTVTAVPSPEPTVEPSPSPSPSPSPTSTPGPVTATSEVTINYNPETDKFKGRVNVDEQDVSTSQSEMAPFSQIEPHRPPRQLAQLCEQGRDVVLRKVDPDGPDTGVGLDVTNDEGRWAIRKGDPRGIFYVVARERVFTDDDGSEVTCERDRSPRLRPPP